MDSYAYTSLDAPDHGDTTKDALERDHKDLVYKLSHSNSFTISFAFEELNEFAHKWGFDCALSALGESDISHDNYTQAIRLLYAFVRNHSTKWESDYETLINFLIERM